MRLHPSLICCLIMLITSLLAEAQEEPFTPIKDLDQFRKEFVTTTSQIKSIKSKFKQEKTLSLLEETMTSEGDFWFKRSDKIRIEYQKPFQYLLIMNNDEILIKDNGKQNKVSTKSNKLFQQINRVILDCVQGTMLDNQDFTITPFENKSSYRLIMKPLQKGLQDFFTQIIVHVSKNDFSVNKLEMYEQGGDFTVINFWNKELNSNVPDSIFDFSK